MNKSRSIGDDHVKSVFHALEQYYHLRRWPVDNPPGVIETAQFIWDKYPNIIKIKCKFQYRNPDQQNDLVITTHEDTVRINLYYTSKSGNIQPKNPGAKSFLNTYFKAPELQYSFNMHLEQCYSEFLSSMLELKGVDSEELSDVKKKRALKELHPEFTKENNQPRDSFLYALKEKCYSLLLESYNHYTKGFQHAFEMLLMLDETTIITRVKKNGVDVELFRPNLSDYNNIKIYKKGRHAVGIQSGEVGLTLRFKFESKPYSSIKIATSYELFKSLDDFESLILKKNEATLLMANQISESILVKPMNNTSNAVGKCNEAFTYYWMLKKFPSAIQADDSDFLNYLKEYLPALPKNTAQQIKNSSEQTALKIIEYLYKEHPQARLDGIQLVADIYVNDRLNTGDIKISIREQHGYLTEVFISLKALRSTNKKITTKNPGIGTILGPTFFNFSEALNNELAKQVAQAKHDFEAGIQCDHPSILVQLSKTVGTMLSTATQVQLRKGIENLLGKALTIITIYEQNKAYLLKHNKIETDITVYPNSPSDIQQTFIWNNNSEEISLRVKFSKGQHHGWSSIKFASEYIFIPNK
ncbi:hypothetical protein ACYEXS_23580 [Paenibacillus sp. MAH-36]|uniref:Uncharacterized protein n=1 Tax=Paenibacillus violae TaxID=3077234 RepID=A0ABU3RPN9_9BACL|nr:hypothetical protein [Paenibacillus sp. PFR10]MDU0205812.1 hypothetical protein [Paenibacillus sp. PFR10]